MNGLRTFMAAGSGLRRRILAAAAALAIALVGTGVVTAHSPDPVFSGRWQQNEALRYAWRSGAVPNSTRYQPAINAAAADASGSRNSQAATFSYASGSSNLIGYGPNSVCSSAGIACFGRNPPSGFVMWMREQGAVYDWGSLRWCQAYSSWPDGCYDVENIMLDEFGHVEMLDHHVNYDGAADYLDAVVQAGSRSKPNAGWDAHAFGRCDVAALQLQYDMQGWGAKYSKCLKLATTLSLTASPTAVVSGGTTTLTAALKIADAASYVRLAMNPVSLRPVILQRRPAGTTTWTTVNTMPHGPVSGTYEMSVTVSSRSEFRAVFYKTSDEGLAGSTSPIVTVAVGS
jgi:hypothetical protein